MMDTGKDFLLDITVGQERHIAAYESENAEFFYLITGQISISRETGTALLNAGDFLIIPAGERHAFSAEEKVLYLIMRINGRAARRYIEPDHLYCTWQISREDNPQNRKVRSLVGRILGLSLSEAPSDRLLYDSICGEFLWHLYRYYRLKAREEPDEETMRKQEIEAYIARNYTYPVRLSDLADHMHFSSVYLSRYFKKLFGMNFLEYLTKYRLSGAKDDLEKDLRRGITQIAFDNGFSNLNSFYTAFKNDCGLSPTEYRAQKEAEAKARLEDETRAKIPDRISS